MTTCHKSYLRGHRSPYLHYYLDHLVESFLLMLFLIPAVSYRLEPTEVTHQAQFCRMERPFLVLAQQAVRDLYRRRHPRLHLSGRGMSAVLMVLSSASMRVLTSRLPLLKKLVGLLFTFLLMIILQIMWHQAMPFVSYGLNKEKKGEL